MKLKPVMLETKDTTPIFLHTSKTNVGEETLIHGKFYHIYLINPAEEIKGGDWILYFKDRVFKVIKIDQNFIKVLTEKGIETNLVDINCNKIIASTDSSLNLPQLSEQAISLLIDYYNKNGKMLEFVEIEEDEEPTFDGNYSKFSEIKLNTEGTVDISIPDSRMYSRGDIILLFNKFNNDKCIFPQKILNNWIEENLK